MPIKTVPLVLAASLLGGAGCRMDGISAPAAADPLASRLAANSKAPSNLSILVASPWRLDLTWQDNSSNETGVELYRSTGGSGYALAATTAANVTSYSDTSLTPGTRYCYEVRSLTTTGKQLTYSSFSNVACASTPAPPPPPPPPPPVEPPPAPSVLWAATYPWQIIVAWADNAPQADSIQEAGFRIERCALSVCADGDFVQIAEIRSKGWTSYQDWYIAPGTTYTYRVRSFNSAGSSAPSNEASATACVVGVDLSTGFYVCEEP